MSHFIVMNKECTKYMYHRRNTGHMYEDRTAWGPDRGAARVFTQKTAAKNAANQAVGKDNYHIFEVQLVSVELVDAIKKSIEHELVEKT